MLTVQPGSGAVRGGLGLLGEDEAVLADVAFISTHRGPAEQIAQTHFYLLPASTDKTLQYGFLEKMSLETTWTLGRNDDLGNAMWQAEEASSHLKMCPHKVN